MIADLQHAVASEHYEPFRLKGAIRFQREGLTLRVLHLKDFDEIPE